MEHIERAGVHSGDSIAVYPPQTLTEDELATLEDYTIKLAKGFKHHWINQHSIRYSSRWWCMFLEVEIHVLVERYHS